ncbi:MAG: alanine--tRNA ligase [Dehalococcoidia bacterium]|nr:MAG: alanine--tRNA ligase [Dehalococcoidia bacterium]
MMTSDEIRSAFLDFFVEKRHKVIPSSSLVPKGDPTLLLTTAGMVQFKPYFLGQAVPPNPRLASCQKCFRTTDIEVVGDVSHLTFFEMLGNFSVGDYFKKEAVEWGWEFVTRRLGLPPQRLWATIFLDDDEAFRLWRKQGIPESKILRFGEEDNFWGPAGDSGPCGPCSEIHYDFGEEFGCGRPSCAPNCECGRFSEVWNLVFMQYNQDKAGKRTPLPKPNIDTGMGLERTVAIMQGKTSVYETDLFLPLLNYIAELAGKKYQADSDAGNAMRVIAEHGRGIAFLIGDGVTPSNEGRGYVLRRLLRRAVLFGRRLDLKKPFLAGVAKITIGQMKHIYPELKQRKDFILKTIESEETRFNETLTTGLELLADIMSRVTSKGESKISGKKAFKLYDTYGFPVASTAEIAAEHGLAVDMAGFEKEMEKQRERARAARRIVTLKGISKGETVVRGTLTVLKKATPFVGYRTLEHKAIIIGILVDGKSVDSVATGQEASLILDSTPFYAEMGGQVGDSGEIASRTARFAVANAARIPTDIVVHQGKVAEGGFSTGDEVVAKVDGERRCDIARNHTATHLLQAALREVLGEHVQQKGSLVAPQRLRFDFSHPVALSREEIDRINHIVNQKIRQNLKAYDEELAYKKALAEGAIALFEEKYGDKVRVMKIGEPVISAELCGGTHVATTGEIGFFHIVSESSIGAGLRRIEAVTGRGAEEFIEKRLEDLQKIAENLDTELDYVLDKAFGLVKERDRERRLALTLARELARKEAESLLGQVEVVNGINLLVAKVSCSRMELMREMCDFIRDKLKSVIVVLGGIYGDSPFFVTAITPDLVAKGYNAGDIVNEVAKVAGGGGGGKAGIAQAGGKDKGKLDEALGQVPKILEKLYSG